MVEKPLTGGEREEICERSVDKRFSVWLKVFENAGLDLKVANPQLAARSLDELTRSDRHRAYLKPPLPVPTCSDTKDRRLRGSWRLGIHNACPAVRDQRPPREWGVKAEWKVPELALADDGRTSFSWNSDISIAAFKIKEFYFLLLLSVAVKDSCPFV